LPPAHASTASGRLARRVKSISSFKPAKFRQVRPGAHTLRFHRNLVWIHPFPNGNGRHARLMADLLAIKLGRARFSWGANANLVAAGQARMNYIAALKAADQGQYAPLIEFGRT